MKYRLQALNTISVKYRHQSEDVKHVKYRLQSINTNVHYIPTPGYKYKRTYQKYRLQAICKYKCTVR